jgi:hypothetical protein
MANNPPPWQVQQLPWAGNQQQLAALHTPQPGFYQGQPYHAYNDGHYQSQQQQSHYPQQQAQQAMHMPYGQAGQWPWQPGLPTLQQQPGVYGHQQAYNQGWQYDQQQVHEHAFSWQHQQQMQLAMSATRQFNASGLQQLHGYPQPSHNFSGQQQQQQQQNLSQQQQTQQQQQPQQGAAGQQRPLSNHREPAAAAWLNTLQEEVATFVEGVVPNAQEQQDRDACLATFTKVAADSLSEYAGVMQVALFGSGAAGLATHSSDLDVVLLGRWWLRKVCSICFQDRLVCSHDMPVRRLSRIGFAGQALQNKLCRTGFAGQALQNRLCRTHSLPAARVLAGSGCCHYTHILASVLMLPVYCFQASCNCQIIIQHTYHSIHIQMQATVNPHGVPPQLSLVDCTLLGQKFTLEQLLLLQA